MKTQKLINKIQELSKDIENGNSRWLHLYDDAPFSSQCEMEGYQWALNDIMEILSKKTKS